MTTPSGEWELDYFDRRLSDTEVICLYATMATPIDRPFSTLGAEDKKTELDRVTQQKLQSLLDRADELCRKCDENSHVPGMNKLRKKCDAEMQFLCRVGKKKNLDLAQLSCTNLSHLEAVHAAAEVLPHVVQVLQPFRYGQGHQTVVVDVVCNHGYTWVKVIARKAQALHLIWAGQGQFGEKSILDQATTFQTCAALYPVSFTTPQVVFLFTSGITSPLSEALLAQGVVVSGDRVSLGDSVRRQLDTVRIPQDPDIQDTSVALSEDEDAYLDDSGAILTATELLSRLNMQANRNRSKCDKSSNPNHLQNHNCDNTSASSAESLSESLSRRDSLDDSYHGNLSDTTYERVSRLVGSSLISLLSRAPTVSRVNVDITALICLVSNVCHGHCHLVFADDILTQQAEWERERPVLPKLNEFMKGKELFVCETAVTDFRSILDTVGGPQEKERAKDLLTRVSVIPDQISERVTNLNLSHQVKQRAKTIFGTGDSLQAVTMTANSGFVRSAMKQGINFAVFLHESRALTEMKEPTAVPMVNAQPTTEHHNPGV